MLLRLPDSPTDAKFLTEKERRIAVERLKDNQAGFKNNEIDRGQILEAFKDVQTWLLATLMFTCNIANGGFTTVCPSLPAKASRNIYKKCMLTSISSMVLFWRDLALIYFTPYSWAFQEV